MFDSSAAFDLKFLYDLAAAPQELQIGGTKYVRWQGTAGMADDELKDAGGPETGRPKREPPTIDLDASEVSGETRAAEAKAETASEARAETSAAEPAAAPPSKPISPWVIAPFSGAVAAALVIAVGWMLGWPPVQAPPAAPQVTASAFDDLGKRVAGLETKTSKPASDVAAAARIDGLDKSLAALRSDLATQRAQSDKLASAVNDLKSAPRDSAGNVDLSALTGRIVELERKAQAQSAEITREGEKAAEAKPADDMPLRRVVAAALLDVAVRHGDPYAETLKVAKSLSADPDKLKALDTFAEKGVPSPPQLNRELLMLVPKLSPPPSPDTATTGTSIVDRLQAGAAKLVRVERTDTTGNDRGAIVARVTAAALRNDFAESRRDLAELSPADRAPAQAWLDKAAARDAALAASRQFADDAMAALANPGH